MRLAIVAGLAVSLSVATVALAQAPAAAPPADDAAAPAGAAKPRPRKPSAPRAAQVVTVTNATANTATEVEITADEKTVKVTKPLKPKGKTTVKLPRIKGCTVQVAATFEGEGRVDAGEFDVCKDKQIRFTE
jgi:hypothetical protein